MENTLIQHAIKFVKEVFENDYSGHDYFHTMRVYKMATHIATEENADLEIVQLAALLHDVDDRKLSPETHDKKEKAVTFLKSHNVSDETIDRICRIISEISFSENGDTAPETIEGKCVQDADRLDALGAIGIARTFAYGGSHNRMIYHPDIKPDMNMNREEHQNRTSTTINHFYEKLFCLTDIMNTVTAKEIAKKRESYMKEYIGEFIAEWKGEK